MSTKTWTGNAQPVAQIETWAPGTQPPGTTATAAINGKTASYTSPTGTNDDLIAGLIKAIAGIVSTAPEFNEITFAATAYSPPVPAPNATYLQMTAKTPGDPFAITISLSTPAKVTVTRTAAGKEGVNEIQRITISPNAESGSGFTVQDGVNTSGQIPTPPSPPMFNAFVGSGALTGAYYYVVTFGTALGETEPSAASAQISPAAQNVTLNIPLGCADCTFRRVYRGLVGGAATGPFFLVGTIGDNFTTTYTDSSTDATIKLNAGPPATNGCLQGALEAMTGIGLGNVKVSGAGTAAVPGQNMPTSPIVYTVQFTGALAAAPQPLLLAAPNSMTILPTLTVTETVAGCPIQSAVQLVGWKQVLGTAAPSGSLKITLPGLGVTTAPLVYNASAATVLAAIQAAAPAAYVNSFAVVGGPAAPATQPQLQTLWQITYQDKLANVAVPQATVDVLGMVAATGDTLSAYYSTTQIGTATGQNETVTVTINNGPLGGTFGMTATLANGNVLTASGVAFNASNVALQNAFPAGTASVIGNAGGPYTVEGVGEAGSQKVTFVAQSSLTGGSLSPGSVPSANTAGVDPPVVSTSLFTSAGSLPTGTRIYYVTAVNVNGETTGTQANVNVTGPDGGVQLTWNAVPTATSYNVYGNGGELLASTTQRVYLDYGGWKVPAGLPGFNGTYAGSPGGLTINVVSSAGNLGYAGSFAAGTYYYKITSINSLGESLPSNEVSATLSSGYNFVSLSWNAVAGATGYKVYRGTATGAENTLIATLAPLPNPSFIDLGQPDTANSPPIVNNAGAGGASLQLFLGGQLGPGLLDNGAILNGSLPPATYYYKATFVTASGESLPSNEVSAPITALGQIPVLQAGVGFNVQFPNNATALKIYRGTTQGGENTLIANVVFGTAPAAGDFYDLGATATAATPPVSDTTGIAAPVQAAVTPGGLDGAYPAGTYYYKVTATTANGETTPSNEENATIAAGGFATINWAAVANATGYKIYRGTGAGAENTLVGVVADGAATSFTDTYPVNTAASPPTKNTALIAAPVQSALSTAANGGNLASATYYYKATAFTRAGETTGSNEQSIAVTGPTGQVTVSWGAVTGADGYKVYRGTAAGAENVYCGSTTNTTLIDYGNASASVAVTEVTTGAPAVNEVQVVTLTGATGGTFLLDAGGHATGKLPYNDTAADVATQLAACSTIGAGNVAVSGVTGGPYTVTYQGTLAGAPQPLLGANSAALTGSITAAQSLTIVSASTGPNNWDNAANWSPAGVPATGDSVYFQNSNVDCLYGLAQSAVTLANLQIDMSYVGGWIGLPNWNSNKYSEYRQQYLQIGVSGQVVIGNGKGSGPTLMKFDFGTQAFKMLVNGCGTNQDPTLPAILVKGSRASGTSEIDIYKGRLGVAMFAGETAIVDTIRQGFLTNKNSDSYVNVGQGVTLTSWYKNGGDGVLNTPVVTLRHELGTLTVVDGLIVTTITTCSLVGGTLTDRATGTITTLTVGSTAIYDRTDDSRPKTITNTTIYGKSSFLDPHGSITFTNPGTIADASIPDLVELDLGTNITFQRVQL